MAIWATLGNPRNCEYEDNFVKNATKTGGVSVLEFI